MITRKSVTSLTPDERAAYVRGVKAIKASGKYNGYVEMHNNANAHPVVHRCPSFLPWHREFILRYERDLQNALGDSSFGLPYWDWASDAASADPKQASVWGADFMGGQGAPVATGPFVAGQWTLQGGGSLARNFANQAPTLPTQADVDSAISASMYDAAPWDASSNPSFRNQLEGWINGPQMHNRVHVWVGGSMLPLTSPDDPVFFLHHANVDRIWALWQLQHPAQSYLPAGGVANKTNLNDPMWPWNTAADTRSPASVLDTTALGYIYQGKYAVVLQGNDNSFVEIPNAASLSTPNQITIEGWVKGASFNGGNWQNAVFSRHADSCGWELRLGEAIPRMMVTVNGTHFYAQPANPASAARLSPGQWYHVAGTYDGSKVSLYLNGQLLYSTNVSGPITPYNGRVTLGRNANPSWDSRWFNGSITDVRLWNTARSQAQIAAAMNQSLKGNEAGLIGYWPLNIGYGTVAADASPSKNNGTIKNASWAKRT
ncbi:MAG: tyrosinase [Lacunisphaera sp.]|nr:tyrosinase [Lacunisphaera sp.]